MKWNNLHQWAFDELRPTLSSKSVLQGPDYDKESIIQKNASDYGIGEVLSQETYQEGDRPMAYFSRKFYPCKINFAVVGKESLAITDGSAFPSVLNRCIVVGSVFPSVLNRCIVDGSVLPSVLNRCIVVGSVFPSVLNRCIIDG